MGYVYSPPTKKITVRTVGSQMVGYDLSTTTWRINGVWRNGQSPSGDVQASVDVVAGVSLYFNQPSPIPDSIYAELQAFGVGTLTTV